MGARDQMAQIMAGAPNFAYRKTPKPSDFPDLSQGQITQPDVWSNRADKVDQWNIPGQIVKGVAMQPVHAGEAVAEAINDPSIPNMTNAGVQTGMALFQPGKALGALGLGYGAAALKDADASLVGSANAEGSANLDMPGLSQSQMKQFQDAQLALKKGRYSSGSERRTLENTVTQMMNISADYAKTKAASDAAAAQAKAQAEADVERERGIKDAETKAAADAQHQREYNSSVGRADAALEKELSTRNRFADSEVGKVYNKLGIATPGLLAMGAGGLSRAVSGGGSKMLDYGLPAIMGGGTGAIAANYPLMHDVILPPAENPERKGYEAYARELPPDHPRKQEWTDYAQSLPVANPTREIAAEQLYDPKRLAERSGLGILEGILGGVAGAEGVRLPGRVAEWIAAMPGRVATSAARSGESAATAQNSLLETLRKAPQSQGPQGLPTSLPYHPSPEVPQLAPPSAAAPTALPSMSAPQSLPALPTPLVDALNGNTAAINDLLTNLNTSKVPVNGGVGGAVQKTSLDDIWASKHSDNARNIIADHLAGGGNIIPKMPAKKGGMPIEALDKQIAAAAGGKGVGKPQTGQRLDVLRGELSNQGLDITTLTNPQFLEALKRIDPRTFSIPLMVGAGAAGLSGNPRDDMARILAGGS